MSAILALDQGTTSSRAIVFNHDGSIRAVEQREFTQIYPQAGWVEHDAEEILTRTMEAAREAVEKSGVMPKAIGITNQRETVVIWERATGRPVVRAIVWQDRRTSARCEELRPRADEIARLTGLVIDPYFSATKLEWLLRDAGVAARARAG